MSRASLAFLLGIVVAGAIVLAQSRADIDRTAFGDGEIYRYIAMNMDAEPDEVHPVIVERGTSLRYGRIGLPAVTWLLAGGQDAAIPWVHALLMVLSGGAAAMAMSSLFPSAPPLIAIVPFLAPGFSLSISGGFAEAALVALVLWAVLFAVRGRWPAAALALGAALLVKESAVVVLLGLGVWVLLRRNLTATLLLAASVIPGLVWYLIVRARYGYLPPLDPYLRDTTGIRPPGVAVVESIKDASSARSRIVASVHLGLAFLVAVLARTSLFALLATAAGLPVLISGPFAWEYIGESARVFVLLQLFVILALVARMRPGWTHPVAVGIAPE